MEPNCQVITKPVSSQVIQNRLTILRQVELANKAFKESQNQDPSYLQGWVGQALLAEHLGVDAESMDLFRHATFLGNELESCLGYAKWVCKYDDSIADVGRYTSSRLISEVYLHWALTVLSKEASCDLLALQPRRLNLSGNFYDSCQSRYTTNGVSDRSLNVTKPQSRCLLLALGDQRNSNSQPTYHLRISMLVRGN